MRRHSPQEDGSKQRVTAHHDGTTGGKYPGFNRRSTAKNAGIAIRYETPATQSTAVSPNEVAKIGTSAAPMTEKQPLMPQAHRNMCCLPRRPSVVIAVGIGKPIRNAGGKTSTKQRMRRTRYGKVPMKSSTRSSASP